MLRQNIFKKVLFYFIFSVFIAYIVIEPNILLSVKDGALILLFVFILQVLIDKRLLLNNLSEKYTNQNVLINNLFMNCPDLIYTKDVHLNYISCNPCMKSLLNLDKDVVVSGRNDFDLFPQDTAETIRNYDQMVIKKRQVVSYRFEKKTITGEIKIYDALIAPTVLDNKVTGVFGIMRDVTQTELLKEKIIVKNAQLNSIIDNIPFLLYLVDLDGKIVLANKKLAEHVKIPVDNLIGCRAYDLFSSEYNEHFLNEDEDVKKNKALIVNEFVSAKYTREPMWWQIIKSPIINEGGDVMGVVVLVKNINEEKRLQAQKETFVATLTHDLKTPTTAQTNAMKLLLNESLGSLNNDQKEMIQLALDSNIYMSKMLATIIATYKSESGEAELIAEQFNFIELINDTCNEVSNLASEKGQSLILKSEITNPLITADKLQIKRAIVNLVSNAITYGQNNTNVEICLTESAQSVGFDIKNKSRYIPPDKLKEIFEKYKSIDGMKFNKSSTGLGLYLSKQIINSHDGEIHASSFEDSVCIFGFSIPKEFRKPLVMPKKNPKM